jgi:hypothetical protein
MNWELRHTSAAVEFPSEDEKHWSAHTERGPEIIPSQRLLHVVEIEKHEHGQSDHLLHDLELGYLQTGITDAIGGHLDQVFEEGDSPEKSAATGTVIEL